MWAMCNTKYWTNWPSSTGSQYTPSSWRNYFQMTSIDMLTHLRACQDVGSEEPRCARNAPPGSIREGRCSPERSSAEATRWPDTSPGRSCIYLVTFWVAVTIDWAIPRFMPGDPVQQLLSRMQAQPGAAEALTGYYTKAFGFDVPLWKQYLNFWAALFHGDLGRSIMDFPTAGLDADHAARCRTRSRCSCRRSCSASGPGTRSARSPPAARRSTTGCCRSRTC